MHKSFLQESAETQRKKPVTKGTWKEIESERRDQQKPKKRINSTMRNTLPAEIPFDCDSRLPPLLRKEFTIPKASVVGFRAWNMGVADWAEPGCRSRGLRPEKHRSCAANNPESSHATPFPTTQPPTFYTRVYVYIHGRARSGNSAKKRGYTA